ncbi:molybdenum cofactor guanylyltransferase [Halorubrum sp. DTA98]|uniref:molybdenum cofactor guanylyltransferase n=1 Tax=Halorubrum sp. DTA98 TaxID=3402163 RepID=UPI003AAAACAB
MVLDATPIVVAGGRSLRFGSRDKLVAELNGRPLIDRAAVAVARATRTDPIVATRDRDHASRLDDAIDGVTPSFVHDDEEYEGPVAGVAAALDTVDTPWVFVCGGDMPWLSPRAIRRLGERAEHLSPAGVVPVSGGHPEPLHGVYRVNDLRRAIEGACPRTSLRGVVERLSPLVTVPATHADDSLRHSLADVDEHADLLSGGAATITQ